MKSKEWYYANSLNNLFEKGGVASPEQLEQIAKFNNLASRRGLVQFDWKGWDPFPPSN
jgi:hypothetical protein